MQLICCKNEIKTHSTFVPSLHVSVKWVIASLLFPYSHWCVQDQINERTEMWGKHPVHHTNIQGHKVDTQGHEGSVPPSVNPVTLFQLGQFTASASSAWTVPLNLWHVSPPPSLGQSGSHREEAYFGAPTGCFIISPHTNLSSLTN